MLLLSQYAGEMSTSIQAMSDLLSLRIVAPASKLKKWMNKLLQSGPGVEQYLRNLQAFDTVGGLSYGSGSSLHPQDYSFYGRVCAVLAEL